MGDRRAGVGWRERARPYPPWTITALRLILTFLFLYLFLVGVKALEKGIGALGSDFVDEVFSNVSTPMAGLAAGILATVLVQSSSVTTATIVGLVGSGVLSVEAAVPMVMGANIGTTVTNSLASLGHLRQGAYFQRAFAAATMHDYFNILAVIILLPLEVTTGLIHRIAAWASGIFEGNLPDVNSSSPVKDAVSGPVDWMTDLIDRLGWGSASGPILLGLGIVLIFSALYMITRQMKAVMSGRMENAINSVLSRGAGLAAMMVGTLMTVAVQSSSITTSILVPLVAAGVLTISNAFPVTLGANLGTTITAVLASVAAESPDALTIALAHVTFNFIAILIWYPLPFMRRIPLWLAEQTANVAVAHKSLVAVYLIGLFLVVPIAILVIT